MKIIRHENIVDYHDFLFIISESYDSASAVKLVFQYGKLWPDFDGFDLQCLKRTDVNQVCVDSHRDLSKVGMPDLSYCALIPK